MLILLMLVIIPLLNQNDADVSLNLAVQLVHNLATLNATNPAVYEVSDMSIFLFLPNLMWSNIEWITPRY